MKLRDHRSARPTHIRRAMKETSRSAPKRHPVKEWGTDPRVRIR
jgi:hypothetical protein